MPNNQPTKKGFTPFWQPWGALGCLWRSILFLLGLAVICLLLSLLRGCDKSGDPDPDGKFRDFDSVYRELPDTTVSRYPVPDSIPQYEDRDTAGRVSDWDRIIPGVPELPDPDRNRIPPRDSTIFDKDPEDPFTRVAQDQLNVFFNSKDLSTDMADFARQFKQIFPSNAYEIVYYNPTAGTMILRVPVNTLEQTAQKIESSITNIQYYIATNEVMQEGRTPKDPAVNLKHTQAYLDLIQAFDAWDITTGSPDVKVAIVDSYFDLSNPEIGERYTDAIHIPSKTRAVLPPRGLPTDDESYGFQAHGSHVAGIAIGAMDNGRGLTGIAPACTWIPISLGDEMTSFNVFEGILYAIYQGADVVNVSLGRTFPEDLAKKMSLEEQVAYCKNKAKRCEALWNYIGKVAVEHDCLIVVAAGNDALLMGMDPGNRNDNIIKVEAVDEKGIKANFSNYGEVPEAQLDYSTVAAPGVGIWSVLPQQSVEYAKRKKIAVTTDDGFGTMQGTSMAAPVVTGAVALLKSKNPNLKPSEIVDILVKTAKQTDTEHRIGPTIQLADALKAAGGEMMNFDEVINDNDKIIGKWKSTHEIKLVDNLTKKETDTMWAYFIFDSPTSGSLEYHTINGKQIYSAPLSVKITDKDIFITQLRDATCVQGVQTFPSIDKDDFKCRPNEKRQLSTDVVRGSKKRFEFLLEKVN